MDNIIVLRSINEYLLKKSATMLKCSCKNAYLIITPKYFPLFKQLSIKSFSCLKEDFERETMIYDYNMVVKNKLTHLFKKRNPDTSFMWHTRGPEWDFIRTNSYSGHSGASWSMSMRALEYIFKNGYYKFYFNKF